ncbi:MAG: PQQ-binding-like beta-propeller repeat protein [Planctomycetes bacterium]|nr:PQQ-binding-like beta-propeller repeat protein [Planctomycetota bacterium]
MARKLASFLAITGLLASAALGLDWPYWRGPEQTGLCREAPGITSWSPTGENLLWKVPVQGRTTPVVLNGRVYLIGPVGTEVGRRERVLALNADTGETVWEHAFNVFHTDIVENRVGWTAMVGDPATGWVYAHGTGGELLAFTGSGELQWKVSLTEEFGRISGYGGRLHSPVLDEDRLLITFSNSSWGDQAAPRHRIAALDKKTGKVLWWATVGDDPVDKTCYATPVIAVIDGVRTLVLANGEGNVYGLKARTGEQLWVFRLSKRGLNATPVVDGNYVYAAHSEENYDTTEMGRVVCIDASKRGDITQAGEVWRVDGLAVGYASPAVAKGRLYVVDNSANLFALDGKTGKQLWKFNLGRVGKASPTVTADGLIYVGEQNGVFYILKDEGSECKLLDREEFNPADQTIDEIYGSPAVANGRVYFMTRYATYCLGKKGSPATSAQVPAPAAEKEAASPAPGRAQVIPAEVTLAPGAALSFTARQYSDDTINIRSLEPQWSVVGVRGRISEDGTFTAAPDNVFSAGHVVAKGEGFEVKARVRISPKLPIQEDFEGMAVDSVPPGWVGVARKTKIVERDGSKVLQKLAEDPAPPFMRVQPYLGPPVSGGYTLEADVLGTPRGEMFKPDMGLVNSRYNLSLMGGDQVLRLETWNTLPRLRKEVPFPWVTEKWYRMKFEVRLSGEQALLRGKVWPKDATEPAAWTLEATDPFPNREGSPGLYGFSPGTTVKSKGPEVFYDNLKVTPND